MRNRWARLLVRGEEQAQQSLDPLAHLTKWFDPKRLTVDLSAAHNFVELGFARVVQMIEASSLSEEEKAEARGRANLKLNAQIASLRALKDGNYNLSNTGRDERLHSVLTNIKRELRSFIQFDGQFLVTLDIKSSQPYFFTKLMRKRFYSASAKDRLGFKSLVAKPTHKGRAPHPPSTTTSPPSLNSVTLSGCLLMPEKHTVATSEIFKISWNEGFYKHFARLVAPSPLKKEAEEAAVAAAKRDTMFLLFDSQPRKFSSAQYKAFKRHFPCEAEVLSFISRLGVNLPVLLQRLESRVILEHVTKRVAAELPDAVMLTVHDSILTTPGFSADVEQIMASELASLMHVQPGISADAHTSHSELGKLQAFAQGIFTNTFETIRKRKGISYAQYQRDAPMLQVLPKHDGVTLFSARYYDSCLEPLYDEDLY
ncbi:hypothetical protein F0P96_07820 [Hymenobacter busanensis]|uniref:Uncharacterized protein n=1 Tax=Hymenobacter busanensis TaxID=2607656 RepID=A0A7L5A314_9BACT|nr:hypothetical protein [Hymenobacter busanensis]KAA9338717.1 hypothetical protein F0P96_07820 [Hymenobacter busanensis]QHJ08852.1 hypothetical protein GUY19_16780 [Hymenobacter busanensis]